jgi:hypothetical protein
MNSAGGRHVLCACEATRWVNSGTVSGPMRLSTIVWDSGSWGSSWSGIEVP